jgi:hypothetical protein
VYDDFPAKNLSAGEWTVCSRPLEFRRSSSALGIGRKMRTNRELLLCLGVSIFAILTLSPALFGQTARSPEATIPVPTDWSHHSLIFSRPATTEQAVRVQQDPRYWQQRYRTQLPAMVPAAQSRDALAAESGGPIAIMKVPPKKKKKGFWAESLGAGASVGAGNYPAKFSFLGDTANCGTATQPDFVVYSTGLEGFLTQASIVAYDNLYTGCGGTVPSVYWAYNTGGQILTSPTFSLDGTQVAFVETSGGFGILVLLKWAPSTTQSVGGPDTLVAVSNAAYPTCTAPCMTQILLADSSLAQTNDITSSIFVDYSDDVGWVGGALGWLHKITPMFKGAPAEVHGGGFPVQLNPTISLASPVYDRISGNVFVGDSGGFLYRVSPTGTVIKSGQLDFGAGIVDSPGVDSTAGLVYVFSSSDGSANCAGEAACSAVYQFSSSFAGGSVGSEVTVGASVVKGASTNPNPLYRGDADSAYVNSTNVTGNLYVCGNTGANPTLYQIPIQAGAMGTAIAVAALTPAANSPACSPVTDIMNPNATGGAAERVFFSVQNFAQPTACGASGCALSFVSMPWQPSIAYQKGQEILVLGTDNNLYVNVVTVGGTSAATPPAWPILVGDPITNGSVTFFNQGPATVTPLPNWAAGNPYVGRNSIVDSNGNVEIVHVGGTSGGTAPDWGTNAGDTTVDNGVTWVNAGVLSNSALAAAGGTSGIIIDNTVGSGPLAGSQIYFSTLSNQATCGTASNVGCAVQASQSGLQ